jgi:hypothetical protein
LREDGCRAVKANCLGGFEVDDKLKISGKLDRQFSRVGALEDLAHVICCSAVLIWEVDAYDIKPPASTYSLHG